RVHGFEAQVSVTVPRPDLEFLIPEPWILNPEIAMTADHLPSGQRRGPLGPSTLAVHAGERHLKPGDAITDPIFCAATYTFPDTQSVIDFIEQKLPREEYGRYGNPGERVVERKLAELEGGETAVLFSTGMAAIVGLLMTK